MTNVTRNTRNEAKAVAPTLMVIGGEARESANGTFIVANAESSRHPDVR